MLIRRGPDAWYCKLSASDAAVMGCEWVPMPLGPGASEDLAVVFAAGTPNGRLAGGRITVEAADGFHRVHTLR